jgi:hypothetical protein
VAGSDTPDPRAAGPDATGGVGVAIVDVKVNLAGADLPRARAAFGLVDATARRAVLHFVERPGRGPTLLDAGVVLRLSEADDGHCTAVVLLRPVWPGRLTPAWTRPGADGPRIRVAGDWTPQARVVAASATGPVDDDALHAALSVPGTLACAFSPAQRALLRDAAAAPSWETLRPFGPVEVRGWVWETDEGPLHATLWTVPATGPELLELRLTVEAADAALVPPVLAALARDHGLDPETFGGTKTRAVLAVLAGRG